MIQAAVVIEVEHNGSNRVLESTKPHLCIVTHTIALFKTILSFLSLLGLRGLLQKSRRQSQISNPAVSISI